MGVVYPEMDIAKMSKQAVELLKSIESKIDHGQLKAHPLKSTYCEGLELFSQSRFIWWTALEDAIRYRVKAFACINGKRHELGTFEIERGKYCLSLVEIPDDIPCIAAVEAEDRGGVVIAKGEIEF